MVDADGTNPTSLGVSGLGPSWSPDGAKIAYETSSNNIFSINLMAPETPSVRVNPAPQ